jgi:hypothetical protein
METIKREIELPKEMGELGMALEKMVKASKQALADGFQAGQDIPAIAVSAFGELTQALGGLQNVSAEAKADPGKIAVVGALVIDAAF